MLSWDELCRFRDEKMSFHCNGPTKVVTMRMLPVPVQHIFPKLFVSGRTIGPKAPACATHGIASWLRMAINRWFVAELAELCIYEQYDSKEFDQLSTFRSVFCGHTKCKLDIIQWTLFRFLHSLLYSRLLFVTFSNKSENVKKTESGRIFLLNHTLRNLTFFLVIT